MKGRARAGWRYLHSNWLFLSPSNAVCWRMESQKTDNGMGYLMGVLCMFRFGFLLLLLLFVLFSSGGVFHKSLSQCPGTDVASIPRHMMVFQSNRWDVSQILGSYLERRRKRKLVGRTLSFKQTNGFFHPRLFFLLSVCARCDITHVTGQF